MELFEVLLAFLYTIIFCYIIYRGKLFASSGLTFQFIIGLFLLKLVVGYVYAYVHYVNGWGDTFRFFRSGKLIYSLFPEHAQDYFRLIFFQVPNNPLPQDIQEHLGAKFIGGYGLVRTDFMIRLQAFLNLFSGGSYIVQCVLFEFLSLIGIIYIYTFIVNFLNFNNKILKIFIFFSPSLLFWLSGMHKETLAIFFLGLILFSTFQLFKAERKYFFVLLILSLIGLFWSRDYVFLLFFPAFTSFFIVNWFKLNSKLVFGIVYLFAFVMFFLSKEIIPGIDLMSQFIDYQQVFLRANSGSKFPTHVLEPNVWSFIQAIPIGLYNSIVHPSIFEMHSVFSGVSALENLVYILLAIVFLIFGKYKGWTNEQQSVLSLFLAFGLTYFILLGIIVDNSGALIRYKSTPLLFLGATVITLFDLNKFKNYLLKNKLLK